MNWYAVLDWALGAVVVLSLLRIVRVIQVIWKTPPEIFDGSILEKKETRALNYSVLLVIICGALSYGLTP